jgi:4-amino-4-deoxy-L-arabinose transferase-like glycosyltransferase
LRPGREEPNGTALAHFVQRVKGSQMMPALAPELTREPTIRRPRGSAGEARRFLLAVLLLFLVVRGATIGSFPIFNDESLYLQYAQLMQEDWSKYKFISMDSNVGDWKPPLQYWIAAPIIDLGPDPLLLGRGLAVGFSVLGLLGTYAFAKELFGRTEARIAAVLFVICPTVLFHNNQFTAETFLFSTAPLLYCAVLRACQPGRARFAWCAAAIVAGAALLLFKQSGALLLVLAIILPVARWQGSAPSARAWKALAWNIGMTAGVIICCYALSKLALPSAFDATKDRFNGKWVMSGAELLRWPGAVWQANLRLVADYTTAYYGWSVPFFCGGLLLVAARRRSLPELALGAMCLLAGGAICLLLRGFNEYMFNTAVIALLLPLLARAGTLVWRLRRAGAEGRMRSGLLGIAGLTVAFWIYQIALIDLSAGRYLERSTPWASANYLKSWPTGFGINEVIAILHKEQQPGLVFTDLQWGNPTVALEVYARREFPNLRVVPITREFRDAAQTRWLRDLARQSRPVRFAIFSADATGNRAEWQANVEREMCDQRTEVVAHPGQMPIVVCRF